MKKNGLYLLTVPFLVCAAASAVTLRPDQSQTGYDTGLALGYSSGLARWQEFTPAYNNVAQIDLLLYRGLTGGSGSIGIALKDESGSTLWDNTIADVSIPTSLNWIAVPVDSPVLLVPGQLYRIELSGQWDGGLINWMGLKESPYDRGASDYFLQDFDYAFKTNAVPEPMTLGLVGFGVLCLRRHRKVLCIDRVS